jgi:hypothetical protein
MRTLFDGNDCAKAGAAADAINAKAARMVFSRNMPDVLPR